MKCKNLTYNTKSHLHSGDSGEHSLFTVFSPEVGPLASYDWSGTSWSCIPVKSQLKCIYFFPAFGSKHIKESPPAGLRVLSPQFLETMAETLPHDDKSLASATRHRRDGSFESVLCY